MKTIKFLVNVCLSKRSMWTLKKIGKNEFDFKAEKIKILISTKSLKERIKFILALLCNSSTEISVRFCDSEEMQIANQFYKKKNYPTDVLSFLTDANEPNASCFYLGDLLICVPVCYFESSRRQLTVSQEIERMIIHGIVHLKGFDHERSESAFYVMEALEKSIKLQLEKKMGKPSWCSVKKGNLL